MYKYAICCTKEQIKNALKLGAPISSPNVEIGFFEDWELADFNIIIIDDKYYNIPTAEQMIVWLEGLKIIHNINVIGNGYDCNWKYEINLNMPDGYDYIGKEGYHSHKDAAIAAIDAALEYLSNKQ